MLHNQTSTPSTGSRGRLNLCRLSRYLPKHSWLCRASISAVSVIKDTSCSAGITFRHPRRHTSALTRTHSSTNDIRSRVISDVLRFTTVIRLRQTGDTHKNTGIILLHTRMQAVVNNLMTSAAVLGLRTAAASLPLSLSSVPCHASQLTAPRQRAPQCARPPALPSPTLGRGTQSHLCKSGATE